jgi:hypothetical protein
MAALDLSIGTVMVLVDELFVVDPKPLRPADEDVVFFFFLFFDLAFKQVVDNSPAT